MAREKIVAKFFLCDKAAYLSVSFAVLGKLIATVKLFDKQETIKKI